MNTLIANICFTVIVGSIATIYGGIFITERTEKTRQKKKARQFIIYAFTVIAVGLLLSIPFRGVIALFYDQTAHPIVEELLLNPSKFGLILLSVNVSAIYEELIFRKYPQELSIKSFGKITGIFVSSSIFGLLHYTVGGIMLVSIATILGGYIGYMYESYGDIKVPIVIHCLINSSTILFAYIHYIL